MAQHNSGQHNRATAMEDRLPVEIERKYTHLREIVAGFESVLVAYSGGVDSALLLKVAVDVLGERAVGALAASPAYDEEDTAEALKLADEIGARCIHIETNELNDPRYVANGADRCYFCKTELFDQLAPAARQLGVAHIVYGMNRDDRGDWRPGQRAARERGVRAPLDEAELGKEEIRAIARHIGLRIWNKPAEACYSSRIPYGTPVTVEALQQIGRAERALRKLGFERIRVRHHDRVARIEIGQDDFAAMLDAATRNAVVSAVRAAGYTFVTLDLQGYRAGSLNEALLRPRQQGQQTHS